MCVFFNQAFDILWLATMADVYFLTQFQGSLILLELPRGYKRLCWHVLELLDVGYILADLLEKYDSY